MVIANATGLESFRPLRQSTTTTYARHYRRLLLSDVILYRGVITTTIIIIMYENDGRLSWKVRQRLSSEPFFRHFPLSDPLTTVFFPRPTTSLSSSLPARVSLRVPPYAAEFTRDHVTSYVYYLLGHSIGIFFFLAAECYKDNAFQVRDSRHRYVKSDISPAVFATLPFRVAFLGPFYSMFLRGIRSSLLRYLTGTIDRKI